MAAGKTAAGSVSSSGNDATAPRNAQHSIGHPLKAHVELLKDALSS